MEDYLIGVGRKLKSIRKKKNLRLSEVAQLAKVSTGLVSKIENGRTIPSLPVLISIVSALDEEMSVFFKGLDINKKQSYYVVRSGEKEQMEREKSSGFHYELIFSRRLFSIGFEVVLLTLDPGATREKSTTDAFECKYVIKGEVSYVIDKEKVVLHKGDTLFFDGRIPHYPENHSKEEASMLVTYFFLDSSNT
ncbi:MAG: XRE family transcriptional regulator [Bacteroidota bacterium]